AVVRRIFQLSAAGVGARRIADTLNRERVPAPVPRRAGRPRSWAPSTMGAVLARPLYRGEVLWNRTEKRDAWGVKRPRRRAEAEWVRHEVPGLRIIDEPLWRAVQRRLSDSKASYPPAPNGPP